jgi:serine carboxypeptidase-like clade 4
MLLLFISCLLVLGSANPRMVRPDLANPGLWPSNTSQYAGYVALNHTYEHGAELFYWGFAPRNILVDDDAPLAFWLSGGPGCSSELALFGENGPFKISPSGDLSVNPYSWNEKAYLFYIDQPVGTGFSYPLHPKDVIHNEDGVAADMYQVRPFCFIFVFLIFG